MKRLRVGLVDLDTSHPGSFVPLLRELGHEVTGVFDSGTVYEAGYAAAFAREHGIEAVCDTLEELADRVDAVFIHSCDWELHVRHAEAFVAAGVAVFVDKPMAGSVQDLRRMTDWTRQGAILTGGSALRYCREVQAWSARGIPAEDWVYGLAGCAVDEFNYGIHAYTLLHGLMGSGIASVRHLGERAQRQIELTWKDGRTGMISIGRTAGYLPFYATLVTHKQVEHWQVDNTLLYRALLEAVLPYLAGEAPAPVAFEELVEVEYAALAARRSAELGGRVVSLDELPSDYAGYEGPAFARYYQALVR
ncbi:hypothetical protein PA598K_00749 [Paenibacillus sp. 598K]|uniref:Gfo/Idh/MocA family protein n=1 Tax=Paenibacillus sp. 598K TaxID=1117987 RepID=UPI000FF9DA06|nr:Gfo/Idh/MocA family oxidoreductase [Paenibacillus sp. 598K]GBF72494.1 hypothetical protein PA598K_00749 [Paenibacillus sp. 598K]